MTRTTIESVAVVGLGQMGRGIAQVAARSGFEVALHDATPELTRAGLDNLRATLDKLVEKGKLDRDAADRALERLRPEPSLEGLARVDVAIEAIVESEDAKRDLFVRLDAICKPEAILASNTSSISITKIAAATSRPDRVVGMHFMNPVPLMKLVELIRGLATSEETYAAARALAEAMGKTVVTSRDYPGFIVNRILMPTINEAVFALMEGLATAEDIDAAMKLGTNVPMGPLALADFIGLDTCLYVLEVLHRDLGDPKFRPCPLLRQYVDAGRLGRKTARGFYSY
jgi:3-hydroxybutyryl-CoA dehydrogenase